MGVSRKFGHYNNSLPKNRNIYDILYKIISWSYITEIVHLYYVLHINSEWYEFYHDVQQHLLYKVILRDKKYL